MGELQLSVNRLLKILTRLLVDPEARGKRCIVIAVLADSYRGLGRSVTWPLPHDYWALLEIDVLSTVIHFY